jgi:DNA-directed RNA polymerase specialized sigma24 family protein
LVHTKGGAVGVEQQWDGARLDELRALYPSLRRFAAVVGRYDLEPDDLVQQAYTQVLVSDPSHVRNLGAYLRRTIVNVAMNERRRTRRADAAVVRLHESTDTLDSYPSELAELLELEPRVRGLLYLVEVEGEPITSAASAAGMSAPAARMALTRARRRLRERMSQEQADG